MRDKSTALLLIEADPAESARISEALAAGPGGPFQVELATRLDAALIRLAEHEFNIVLLDLVMPDGQGIEAFEQVIKAAPRSLVLVLGSTGDEEAAHQAVLRGAEDFFVRDQAGFQWLPRALGYIMERKVGREALRLSEERFRDISDASPLGIFVSDAQGGCVYTNLAYQKISGLSFEQTLGTNWSMAIHPEDRQRIVVGWRDAVRGQEAFQSEVRFLRRDGSLVWTRLNAVAMRDGLTSRGRIQIVEDIGDRKLAEQVLQQAEEALFEEKERAQVTLNSIGDAVLTTNLSSNVTYLNGVAEVITGWPMAEALGRPLGEIFSVINSETREVADNPAQRAIAENQTVGLAADSLLVRRDGSELAIEDSSAPIHNRDGSVAGAVIVFHDVSESREMARKMAHLAQHDFLTGLPNRLLLAERLSQAIGQARRHKKQVGLLFIDLDDFKNINDSLGHAMGDELLCSIANRLSSCIRTTDTVCRHGGDEFVILLAEIEQQQDAAQIAKKLLASAASPHLIGGQGVHVTLSIGISVYPDDGDSAERTMQNADMAMYCAKANGRNNYQFYTSEMRCQKVQALLASHDGAPRFEA